MKRFNRYYTCLLLLLTTLCSRGQELMSKDSLLHALRTAKEDTNRVLLFVNIGQQYENNQPDSAEYYYTRAKLLSEKLNYTVGVIKYISNITYILNLQGKTDSSLKLNLYSVELARKIND